MDPTITVPDSVFIDGQWHAATWLAEVIDDATGELIITATVTQPTSVVALRMDMDLARRLRAMALPSPSTPCDPPNPSTNAYRYDCRTTGQRLAELEAAAMNSAARAHSLVVLSERVEQIHCALSNHNELGRLPDIERRLEAVNEELSDQHQRLSALESTKQPQPLSAVEALRQIASIQARDPDGLKMTWAEIALTCIDIAKKALESA